MHSFEKVSFQSHGEIESMQENPTQSMEDGKGTARKESDKLRQSQS